MILLVLPLRDLLEAVLARREKRQSSGLLKAAIENKAKDIFLALIENGADVNVVVKGADINSLSHQFM